MKFQTSFFISLGIFWFVVLFFILKKTHVPEGSVPLPLTSMLLYFLLCLGYGAESTALENESPSMRIIKAILKNGGEVSLDELKTKFTDQEFIHERMGDLVKNGHIDCKDGIYQLTPRGAFIAKIVKGYRDLIRRGMGG